MDTSIIGMIKILPKMSPDENARTLLRLIRENIDPNAVYEYPRFKITFEGELHQIFCDGEISPSKIKNGVNEARYLSLLSGATMKNGSKYAKAIHAVVALFGGWFADVQDEKFKRVEPLIKRDFFRDEELR